MASSKNKPTAVVSVTAKTNKAGNLGYKSSGIDWTSLRATHPDMFTIWKKHQAGGGRIGFYVESSKFKSLLSDWKAIGVVVKLQHMTKAEIAEQDAKYPKQAKSAPATAQSSTSGKLSDDEIAVMIKAGFTPQRLQQMGLI